MVNFVENRILRINPGYLPEFEEFIKTHAQFGGGAATDKYVEGRAFSNVYEFYIYAYFVGLYNDKKIDVLAQDKTKTFWEMENWKPRELVKYLLACALGKSQFNMVTVEHMDETGVNEEIRKLKAHIEAYANGGIGFMKECLDEDPELVQDEAFFIRFITREPA